MSTTATPVTLSRLSEQELLARGDDEARHELLRRAAERLQAQFASHGFKPRVDGVSSGGVKYDGGKPPLALLPWPALIEVARVLDFGAVKYGRDNWRRGIGYHRLLDAALRHLVAFLSGEDLDAETGISHLAHAMCCILFLQTFVLEGRTDLDDRYKAPVEK